MSKVVVFNQSGGADVLTIEDIQVPAPGADDVQIRVRPGTKTKCTFRNYTYCCRETGLQNQAETRL